MAPDWGIGVMEYWSIGIIGASFHHSFGLTGAIALTKDWPELQYGGRVDVLQEL
jgi:hypothetical protein